MFHIRTGYFQWRSDMCCIVFLLIFACFFTGNSLNPLDCYRWFWRSTFCGQNLITMHYLMHSDIIPGWIRYDCTIMGQPETGMRNHSKVITGQKYSTPVSAFPSKFYFNTEKINSILPISARHANNTTKCRHFRLRSKTKLTHLKLKFAYYIDDPTDAGWHSICLFSFRFHFHFVAESMRC